MKTLISRTILLMYFTFLSVDIGLYAQNVITAQEQMH
jgi:hypothetical protein